MTVRVRLLSALAAVMALALALPAAAAARTVAASPRPAAAGASAGPGQSPVPLARAHAHNDYEHDRPLLDALAHGFTSVEADVWLVDGELRVAHDLEDVVAGRTLDSLYLRPLRQLVASNGGSVYPGYDHSLTLLVDIKSDGEATYRRLHRTLRRHRAMLTTYTRHRWAGNRVQAGAVTVIISGERPRELMAAQRVRYAGYDGRMDDLGSGAPAWFIPLISDNWTNVFTWDGDGPMPADERALLHEIVATAHAAGQRVRFWATPDDPGPAREAVWQALLDARVDHINTDDLAALRDFLLTHDPRPSQPYVPLGRTSNAGRLSSNDSLPEQAL